MKLPIKILLTVFIAVFLYTCSEDTIVNTNITPSGPFTLSGTIQNWIYGGNIKLKAEIWDTNLFYLVLDSTVVGADSTFTVKLNNAPDSLLYPITFYPDSICINNVTVNPFNTKSSYSVELALLNDSSYVGGIERSNYSPETPITPGQFFVYYLYLNQSVSITGSIICNYEPYHDTTIYNFSGVRGWNKVVAFFDSYTQFTSKVTVSATEPAGGKWWVYYVWAGNALSDNSSLKQRIFRLNSNCIHCK